MSTELADVLNSIGQEADRSQLIKSAFGYLGSKKEQLKYILPHLPIRPKYIEHFGGSGIVLLNRQPAKLEVFNDACSGVTAFFRTCADPVLIQQLVGRVRYMVRSREEFVWCRDSWENCSDTVERAARWYYMLQNSFNKKCKVYRRSTGVSGTDAALDSYLPLFYPIHDRIKKTYIENLDWRTSLMDYDCEDAVHYLDPPYYLQENPYPSGRFTKSCHAEMLERVFDLRGYVAISGLASDLYYKYKWDEVHTWSNTKRSTGNAFLDSNFREGLEHRIKSTSDSIEHLYIKKEK